MNATRTAVFILGMHHSGTSALTRIVNLLGAEIPETHEPANQHNAAGYQESRDLMQFHDRLLHAAGSTWDDWRAINEGWLSSESARDFADEAGTLLPQVLSKSPLFVLNDPRGCRFLPFWLSVLQARAINAIAIIPIRNPLEVAAALEHRDHFPSAKSTLLWMRHVLDAEAASRGIPRLVVTYDQLLSDWRGLKTRIHHHFGPLFPELAATSEQAIDAFLSAIHSHHAMTDASTTVATNLLDGTAKTYEAMLELADSDAEPPSILRRLDELRRDFARTSRVYSQAFSSETAQVQAGLQQTRADEINRLNTLHETEINRLNTLHETEVCRLNTLHEAEMQRRINISERWRRKNATLQRKNTELLLRMNALQTSSSWRFAKPMHWLEMRRPNLMRRSLSLLRLLWWTASFSLPRHLALRKQVRGVLNSGLFDETWYITDHPEVIISGAQPIIHWITLGWQQRYNPHPLFDVSWYLERCPEAGASDLDPVSHYHVHGGNSGHDPGPLFDSAWYLKTCPEAAGSDLAPAIHYLRHGAARGHSPSPLFDHEWYMQQSPDLVAGEINPLLHYLQHGASEGRDPNPYFDSSWYLECYPDVAEAGVNPLVHYIRFGVSEGRDPGPRFNTRWYLDHYPEVRAEGENPLAHFLAQGLEQDYRPSPINDTEAADSSVGDNDNDNDNPGLSLLLPDWDGDWEALIPIVTGPADGVLVVDCQPPTPDRDSGSFRMNKILDCLSETGRQLYFIGDQNAPSPEYLQSVCDKGIVTAIGRQQATTLLRAFGSQLGTVILSRPKITERYLPLVRALAVRARVLYDTIDLYRGRAAEKAADSVDMTAIAASYQAVELANIAAADATITSTADERDKVLSEVPDATVLVLPIIHDIAADVPPFEHRAFKHSLLELLGMDSRA